MISITLGWFVFIYLTVFLAGILIFWIGYEMLRNKLSFATYQHPSYCRTCGTKMVFSSPTAPSPCPSCGSLNEPHNQGGL